MHTIPYFIVVAVLWSLLILILTLETVPFKGRAKVNEVCRKVGISEATFFEKYDGLEPSDLRRLHQLQEENAKLKRLVADLSLSRTTVQDMLAKKL